jgi:hypothetical protein
MKELFKPLINESIGSPAITPSSASGSSGPESLAMSSARACGFRRVRGLGKSSFPVACSRMTLAGRPGTKTRGLGGIGAPGGRRSGKPT